jgi:SSS family solute:Na+ symporter
LVLAGLVAAIMSSIDSTLNSASTLVTMDFVKKRRPEASDEKLALIGRAVTILFMLVSAAWVPIVARATTLFEYLQSSLAYLFPPVVAVFVLGFFWRRATSAGALTGLLVGHGLSLAWFLTQRFTDWLPKIHFLVLAGLFLLLSGIVIVCVSLWTPPPSPEQISPYTWSRERNTEATRGRRAMPWYKDYRWLSLGLLVLTAWMVWTYR